MSAKTLTAIVRHCTACQDGGFLVVAGLDHPKRQVSVRAVKPISEGTRIVIKGEGRSWDLAA